MTITRAYAAVQLEMAKPDAEENKRLFDDLEKYKAEIERQFGHDLEWKRMNDKISSQVSYTLEGVNIYHPEDWDKSLAFIATNIVNLERAMRDPLKEIKKSRSSKDDEE
jgi:hypothetical protein